MKFTAIFMTVMALLFIEVKTKMAMQAMNKILALEIVASVEAGLPSPLL